MDYEALNRSNRGSALTFPPPPPPSPPPRMPLRPSSTPVLRLRLSILFLFFFLILVTTLLIIQSSPPTNSLRGAKPQQRPTLNKQRPFRHIAPPVEDDGKFLVAEVVQENQEEPGIRDEWVAKVGVGRKEDSHAAEDTLPALLPWGSYGGSCHSCQTAHHVLSCSCQGDTRTSLDVRECRGGEWVGNFHGRLVCEKMPGAGDLARLEQEGHKYAVQQWLLMKGRSRLT